MYVLYAYVRVYALPKGLVSSAIWRRSALAKVLVLPVCPLDSDSTVQMYACVFNAYAYVYAYARMHMHECMRMQAVNSLAAKPMPGMSLIDCWRKDARPRKRGAIPAMPSDWNKDFSPLFQCWQLDPPKICF